METLSSDTISPTAIFPAALVELLEDRDTCGMETPSSDTISPTAIFPAALVELREDSRCLDVVGRPSEISVVRSANASDTASTFPPGEVSGGRVVFASEP